MKTQRIGQSDLWSPRLSYGCMRIAGTWDPNDITPEREERGRAALLAAYDAGYTLFDHADIYAQGGCESIHGRLLRDRPDLRERTIIATKCGIRYDEGQHRYDFTKKHIVWSCEQSLRRLQVEQIEIYQLHRPDLLMNPAEVAEAFEQLHFEGKVKYFGVSNFSPSFVHLLQSGLKTPLIVNQVEIHLGRLDCFVDGTLDQCLERSITPLSWSPLGGGWLGEGGTTDNPVRQGLLNVLDDIAAEKGTTRTAIALAWLLKHPSGIIPIVGSTRPEMIRKATEADTIELSHVEWYRILIAARGSDIP